MNDKLIVSLPNVDATNPLLTPENFSVHSDYDSFKVSPNTAGPTVNATYFSLTANSSTGYNYGWVTVTITADPAVSSATVFTLVHNLGYVPGCLAMIKGWYDADNYYMMPTIRQAVGDLGFSYSTNATTLTVLSLGDGSVAGTTGTVLTFKYYIFVEDGA